MAAPSATRTGRAANSARSGPLVPVRHETARNAAGRASSSSAAPALAAEGTGCLRGRPAGLRAGGPGMLARPAGRLARREGERHVDRVALLRRQDADRVGEPPLRQAVPEL